MDVETSHAVGILITMDFKSVIFCPSFYMEICYNSKSVLNCFL